MKHMPVYLVSLILGASGVFAAGATYGDRIIDVPVAKADMAAIPAVNETVIERRFKFEDRLPMGECPVEQRDIVDSAGNITGCDSRPG